MVRGYLRGGVPGVPCDVALEVCVAVMHANRVDLLFIALDTVWRTNVITEDPCFSGGLRAREAIDRTASHHRGAKCR